MKIVRGEYPPNFEEIAKGIPEARIEGVTFAWEDIIYVPTGGQISDHLMAKLKALGDRQIKIGVGLWWTQYINDRLFRYDEELIGHRAEYSSIVSEFPNRNQRRRALKYVARKLASPFYGCPGGWKRAADDIMRGIANDH